MKNLAEIKRKMTLGSMWHCVFLPTNSDMGVRKVEVVHTNAVAFKNKEGKISWLEWPKASFIHIDDEKSFTVISDDDLEPLLKYTFVRDSSTPAETN